MIRKLLSRLVVWAQNHNSLSLVECESVQTSTSIGARGMNFSLYSASGGYIVEYRRFDEKRGENINNLHIINTDDDLGERIGQIVTMELLRNN